MMINEQFGNEARIQLNFFSFMSIAIWICFGASIAFASILHIFFTQTFSSVESESTMFWFASLMYGFVGFILSLAGSVIIFPIYRLWCEKMRGQRVKGKFALLHRDE